MKRFAVILTAVFAFMAMTSSVQAQSSDQTDINMSMTVDEYIEARSEVDWDLGETVHKGNLEQLKTGKTWDIAYANCPFNVTFKGDNDAGDGRPIFAREEVGDNANGWDRLPSFYKVLMYTNGVEENISGYWPNSGEFPMSKDFTEAPHDGQIRMKLRVRVNDGYTAHISKSGGGTVPLRKTLIDPSMAPEESADAGVYRAKITATFSAL